MSETPPAPLAYPADPNRDLDRAADKVKGGEEPEAGEETNVIAVSTAARDAALAATGEKLGAAFAACDPEHVTRALSGVQAVRSAAAKRHNVFSGMLAEAAVRQRAAKGERYRREATREVLQLGAAVRAEAMLVMQTVKTALELATARGDDVGFEPANATVSTPTQDDDPVTQAILARANPKDGRNRKPRKNKRGPLDATVYEPADEENPDAEDED